MTKKLVKKTNKKKPALKDGQNYYYLMAYDEGSFDPKTTKHPPEEFVELNGGGWLVLYNGDSVDAEVESECNCWTNKKDALKAIRTIKKAVGY